MTFHQDNFLGQIAGTGDFQTQIDDLSDKAFFKDGSKSMEGTLSMANNLMVGAEVLEVNELAVGILPATGKLSIYAKADKHLYIQDDAAVESQLSSGGDVDFDNVDGTPAVGEIPVYANVDGHSIKSSGPLITGNIMSNVAGINLSENNEKNTWYGFDTDLSSAVGGFNCVFGEDAGGGFAVSGSNNVCIGYQNAKSFNGSNLVSIGSHSALFNASSSECTMVGTECLRSFMSGNNNTCVGYQCIRNSSNVSNCTVVGRRAGLGMVGTVTNDILIGSNAGSAFTSTESNNIIIGSSGVVTDNQTIRIGSGQTTCNIKGIYNQSPGAGGDEMVYCDSSGELGTQAIPTSPSADTVLSTGNLTNLALTMGDGGSKNVQSTTITVANNDELNNVQEINLLTDVLNNTKYGYLANAAVTFGDANTAIGWSALQTNEAGDQNTAVGASVLNLNFGGSQNTGMGAFSLINAQSDDNTVYGWNSMRYHNSGANGGNTILGSNCYSHTNPPTGAENIIIGHSKGNVFTTTESNNILIGNTGVIGDNNVCRIGDNINSCYIDGVYNVTPGSNDEMVIMSDGNQLGTAPISAGDVVGPASSVNNRIALFDGVTGKLLKQSTAILDAAGDLTGLTGLEVNTSSTLELISNENDPAAVTITSNHASGGMQLLSGSAGIKVITGAGLRMEETGVGVNYCGIKAPAAIASDFDLTLPVDGGDADQLLSTDGSGVLSWASPYPPDYINGCVLNYVSATTIEVESGYCTDSTNAISLNLGSDTNCAITTSGANGLDTGSEASNTFYRVFVIGGGGQTVATLMSASDSPTLPGSYTVYRLVGYVRNNSSSNFWQFSTYGKGVDRHVAYRESRDEMEILDQGGGSVAFTTQSVATFAPPGTKRIDLHYEFDLDNDGDKLFLTSGINNQTTAQTVIRLGSGIVTPAFEENDGVIANLDIDPSGPSFDWATSVAGNDIHFGMIAYWLEL